MGPKIKSQNSNEKPQPVKPASGEANSDTSHVTGWLKSKELQRPT